jgi:hypothetical protein
MKKLESALVVPEVDRAVMQVNFEEGARDPRTLLHNIGDFLGHQFSDEDEDKFFFMYRPRHVGAWKELCPDVETIGGREFTAMLRRWGYA